MVFETFETGRVEGHRRSQRWSELSLQSNHYVRNFTLTNRVQSPRPSLPEGLEIRVGLGCERSTRSMFFARSYRKFSEETLDMMEYRQGLHSFLTTSTRDG